MDHMFVVSLYPGSFRFSSLLSSRSFIILIFYILGLWSVWIYFCERCKICMGFLGDSVVKNPPGNAGDAGDRGRKWQPTPLSLPGKSHGQRSLAGYSPWGHKELNPTEHTRTQDLCGFIFRVWMFNYSSTIYHRLLFLYCVVFVPLPKVSWLRLCGCISNLSILFHWSICLLFYQLLSPFPREVSQRVSLIHDWAKGWMFWWQRL